MGVVREVEVREVEEWPYEKVFLEWIDRTKKNENTKEVQIRIRLNAYRINIHPTDSFDSSIELFIVHIIFRQFGLLTYRCQTTRLRSLPTTGPNNYVLMDY